MRVLCAYAYGGSTWCAMRVKAGDAAIALICVAVGHVLGGFIADWIERTEDEAEARRALRQAELEAAAAEAEADGGDGADSLLIRSPNDALAIALEARAPATELRVNTGKSNATVRVAALPLCTVCVEPLLPGASVRWTPCGHVFHAKCLAKWVFFTAERRQRIPLCPNCNLQLGIPVPPRPQRASSRSRSSSRASSRSRSRANRRSANRRTASSAQSHAHANPADERVEEAPIDEHISIVEPPARRGGILRVSVSSTIMQNANENNVSEDLVAEDAFVRYLLARDRASASASVSGAGASQS